MLGKNEVKYDIVLCSLVSMFLGLFNINDLILHCILELSLWVDFWIGAKREKVKGEGNMDRDSEL